jgi:bifunctional DNA-binding transcriptional regulator/antitoxin component of YhaV-PrlF toxin-antitoxin module
MARVTSKLQVTIPKAIAQRYGIEPGQDIEWLPAGEAIRVVPGADRLRTVDRGRRLELFDRATERQRFRESSTQGRAPATGRGWRREDLYRRGVAD